VFLSNVSEATTFLEWISHAKDGLYENSIFGIGILLVFALIGGKLISLINFPKVTGYILIGIIIGPSALGILSKEMVDGFTVIRQVAIGLIGYTIGLELKFSKLRKTGKQVMVITIVQAFFTALVVFFGVYLYMTVTKGNHILTFALILGAIATATAPGPIVAVVKSYRTKGPVTDVLLPLVALDDAIGIMLFALMLSLGTSLISGPISASKMILAPLLEIGLSLFFGITLGFLLQFLLKRLNRESDAILLMIILGLVLVGIGIGIVVHASAILLPMTIGIVLTNTIDEKYKLRLTKLTDLFGAPVLLAFFTIAGAELELHLLREVGLLGLVYLSTRVIGKINGAHISAKWMKAPKTVTKYLGYTLIPQAGVAIDMALTTQLRFSEPDLIGFRSVGDSIMAIILAATVIYEVFGLIVVKTALHKAGEIDAAVTNWQ
jgi:Kef-type K+ transport system membrane component KefB